MRANLWMAAAAAGLGAGLYGMRQTGRADAADERPQIRPNPAAVDPVRAAERRRAPRRPAAGSERAGELPGLPYDRVYDGAGREPKAESAPAKRMPETSCAAVAAMAKSGNAEDRFKGPHRTHELAVAAFGNSAGFGFTRMMALPNERGKYFGAPGIDRLELVSLLLHDDACAYVLDDMPSPPRARAAPRRPLDEFEALALDELRGGAELVGTPSAPTRMFGALRAGPDCLSCHPGAKPGELLGAFSYWMAKPLHQLDK